MAWHAELADNQDIQWNAQRARDFVCHGDAAAREAEDESVGALERAQTGGELGSRLPAVTVEQIVHYKSNSSVSTTPPSGSNSCVDR